MNKNQLRFEKFNKIDWQTKGVNQILKKVVNPVNVEHDVQYKQIGIRSHGKGIFYKELVSGKEIGNKRIFWLDKDLFILNIVFAWERAIARTTEKEIGLVASHRFPMYRPIENEAYLDYLLHFFLTKRGNQLLELASPGGAGRNKTLGQKEFEKLSFLIPSLPEQQKIADYLSGIDQKISLLKEKKIELSRYKKAMMQKIFSQHTRFKDENGNEFTDWEYVQLKDILKEHKEKNIGDKYVEVLSVAKMKGVINQIEHLGRSYSAEKITHYKVINAYDIVYTKSPTSGFPFGIIKQNKLNRSGVLSPLYAVFKPKTKYLGMILHDIFLSEVETYNYLVPLVQKGAKNTMNINNDEFLKGKKYNLPTSIEEQQKISDFLSAIDESIDKVNEQIMHTQSFKKAMLQQMFV